VKKEGFDEIWATVGAGRTDPLPVDATRRIATTVPASTSKTPAPASLPRITLSHPGEEAVRSSEAAPTDADLEITGLLGEGGMGRVHVARQRSLDRDVAVKTVRPGVKDPAVLATLVAEGMITGALEHPSIVPIHSMGVDRTGRPLLVMKRVEGVTWHDILRDAAHPAWSTLGSLPSERLLAHLEILVQVCNAIELAHDRGVVHLDIKPSNVMVGSFGEVYVVDWGIAMRLEAAAAAADRTGVLGTPAYMAPELVSPRGGSIDTRTDVYLLGATLHEIVTGSPRHAGDSLYNVLFKAFESAPFDYAASVPAEIAAICNRATANDKASRYPSVRAFRQAITDYLRHRGSIELSDAARGRLAEISSAKAGEDAERLHRLMTECRFGFMQARQAWPENRAAQAGLERCLEAMAELAIAERRPAAARALLTEFAAPRPELSQRIEALEAELEAERAHNARLARMERDLDLTVASPQRLRMLWVLTAGALAAAVATIAVQVAGGREPSHRDILAIEASFCVMWTAVAVVGRAALLSNAANRRLFVALSVVAAGVVVNRLGGMLVGAPIAAVCVADSVLMAGVSALVASSVMPVVWRGVPLWIATAGVAAAFPPAAMGAFSVTVFLALAMLVAHWQRAASTG
jgi:serine/threonine-protein kinase